MMAQFYMLMLQFGESIFGGHQCPYQHICQVYSGSDCVLCRPRLAVEVLEPKSGRKLTISSTAPGLQFYSGNFLDGSVVGKDGVAYGLHGGFALETQASFLPTKSCSLLLAQVFA